MTSRLAFTEWKPTASGGRAESLVLLSLPTLIVFGPHLSLSPTEGSPINAARIATGLLLLPAFMSLTSRRQSMGLPGQAYLVLAGCLAAWGALGVAWAPQTRAAIEEVATTGAAVLSGLVLLIFASRDRTRVRMLASGWVLAFTVMSAVGVFEKATGTHLVVNQVILADPTAVAGLFGNPNDFAGFLLVSFPFLVAGSVAARGPIVRLMYFSLLATCVILSFWTESRTGILGIGMLAALTLWWLARRDWSRSLPVLIGGGLVVLAGYLLIGLFAPLNETMTNAFAPVEGDSLKLSSEYQRWNLVRLGLGYGIDSALLGQGPASFEFLAARDAGGTRLDGIVNAHNVFVEIFAQFGLVVIVPFLILLVRNFRTAFAASTISGSSRGIGDPVGIQILLGTAAIIMAGSVSSSTLDAPWWWAAIGAVTAQAVVASRSIGPPATEGVPGQLGQGTRSS